MLEFLDPFRTVNFLNMAIRMILATVCSGIIGIERAMKRRPAGLRTHILICLGAVIATSTSVYLIEILKLYTDIARLGAQVIAGVGFIGTGAIVVTRNRHVKGLTTAAGLWAVAIVGLAIGAGFYEGGVIAAILIFLSEFVLGRFSDRVASAGEEVALICNYTDTEELHNLTTYLEAAKHVVLNFHAGKDPEGSAYALYSLRLNKGTSKKALLKDLEMLCGQSKVRIL